MPTIIHTRSPILYRLMVCQLICFVKLSSLLMHDIHNNLIPSNLSDMFTLSHQIHNRNTRFSSAGNYYINCSRLNQNKNSFSRIGRKIWNSIPGNVRNLPKHIFKEKITILFQNLQVQDSYVDLEQIISDMSKARDHQGVSPWWSLGRKLNPVDSGV